MTLDPALYTLLGTAISVIVAGVVAVMTSHEVGQLKDQLATANSRIAVLEEVLKMSNVPVPPLPAALN